MTISAKIVADSISTAGVRLTTMQLCYPRFIHAEFMTHRAFSRNASSSRAIPVAKMIEQVRNDPAMPIHWGKNQAGMQAREELTGHALWQAKEIWRNAAKFAATCAESMAKEELHKQCANRILEPFQHINVIVTATEWGNFFALRAHPDAQPEIQALAIVMKAAMNGSTPVVRGDNPEDAMDWHLPYVSDMERSANLTEPLYLAKLSTARNARVSYLTHDGENPDAAKDVKLHDNLVGAEPIHASPTEHVGYPLVNGEEWDKNFRGWAQYRSTVEASFIQNEELSA